MQMMGHLLLSRGLWRAPGTGAATSRLLPPAPVLGLVAALPGETDDVLFWTMFGMYVLASLSAGWHTLVWAPRVHGGVRHSGPRSR